MKTLLIFNHTKHLDELRSIFPNAEIVAKEDLAENLDISPYNLIVISGGSGVPSVLRHPEEYSVEMKLIQNAQIPILGICLGSEIIISAFGGELMEFPIQNKGEINLEITDENLERTLHNTTVQVYEAHYVGIKKLPDDFVVCAHSEHGIEIIKNTTKPIVGIQFHPEVNKNSELFEWIFKTLSIQK